MKRSLLFILSCLSFTSIFSQLYVSQNSYVFVNNQFVFVTQDVNLQTNGDFYLRNNSQLLQGTSGTSTNKGGGKLSVFQEGTVNNYQYNYWCSPVGNASATPGNESFGITMLHQPTGLRTSTPAIILPQSNRNGVANPLSIAPNWIWKFIQSNAYAQWIFVGSTTNINPGEGFTMKGTAGTDSTIAQLEENIQNNPGSKQRYDFRGKPNDGDISVPIADGNLTLVGNPYPSAVDLNAYLMDASNASVIDGPAYFWEQAEVNSHYISQYEGGYGVYTPVTNVYTRAVFLHYNSSGTPGVPTGVIGTDIKRRYAPVGQGFMVRGKANGVITMKNSFRRYVKEGASNNSEFARNNFNSSRNNVASNEVETEDLSISYLRINALFNDSSVRPTTLTFFDTATDGVDYGADAISSSGIVEDFYFVIPDDPHEYVVAAVRFDVNKRIPVAFRCNATTNFKLQVKESFNFDPNQNVYLLDKSTGIFYDIKNNYFDITLPASNDRNRFEITFTNTILSNPTEVLGDVFTIIQENSINSLKIYNPESKDIVNFELYDITGKLVLKKQNMGKATQYEFSTSAYSNGLYVVKLDTRDNLKLIKKIIIENK
ncbi:T9SS type A sorting domain-containing protein [Flavobacterium sp. HXWNR69]|uniref:T9SS type A sorting domain-containing protein n=1 Tax=Flavobacterium fragile TaxID=2949085 RepID=A0ABT0TDS3_9FLAO|nr:T9SS type A sorting domain-containing protein [Flavobacterium sp. HXWNR69]MCL9769118.1 T9SS type A sorting domain-containing protein [Flavobacterium sp. HXWNR69]